MVNATAILNARILIVDDREANVLLLKQVLRGAGYLSVESTMDSSKVCELHLVNRYDLILLDLEMPGMDGFQVMENLRDLEQDGYLPVLVITAHPDHKMRALKAGAKDFVSKPFELAEVLIRVHNMIEVRLLHLEMKTLYERVTTEQRISKRLLLDVLPHAFTERLGESAQKVPDNFTDLVVGSSGEVTVLFADIVEFMRFSEGVSSRVLMGVLDDISGRFDGGGETQGEPQGLDRNKTIGDAYMAAAGLPDPLADQSIRAALMVLDMTETLDRFNAQSRYRLKVRIGIDTDGGAAGVEKRSFVYDL